MLCDAAGFPPVMRIPPRTRRQLSNQRKQGDSYQSHVRRGRKPCAFFLCVNGAYMQTGLRSATVSLLMLCATVSFSAAATDYRYLYGDAAPSSAANYTIVIRPDTRYVNVQGGDTVNFVAGDRQFAWTFNVARTVWAFDLNDVAPPGALDHTVKAYISPDPKYIDAP